MIQGIADTSIIIHILRRNPAAADWFRAQNDKLAITPITWLEVMYGAPGKQGQQTCEIIMARFEMLFLTPTDMQWAMDQLKPYRLSHGVAIMDCLIASVAYRLQLPLYTHNLKDMRILLDPQLVISPF